MKKIGKKKILGITLLTSLSIFAGTTITANNNNRATTAANSMPNDECKPPHKLQKDSNGNLVNENGNIIKKPDPAKIEELKKKLTNGKITKDEASKLIEMLNNRHRGPRSNDIPKN